MSVIYEYTGNITSCVIIACHIGSASGFRREPPGQRERERESAESFGISSGTVTAGLIRRL